MDILVTYDVQTAEDGDEVRLRKVARVCASYGTRVQDSVFECRLSAAAFERLMASLRQVIDPERDSVHIYRFEGPLQPARISLGRAVSHEPGRPWIV